MPAAIKIEFDVSKVAAQLELVQGTMNKLEPLMSGMAEALRPTAAAAGQLAPQPGSPGFSPLFGARKKRRRLAKQMVVATRLYPRNKVIVGVAGPRYARKGGANHGHLVEFGHRIASGRTRKGEARRELKREQKAGWTNELVYSERLKTLVYKHGAPHRNTIGARIVPSAGVVAPKPFLAPAVTRTRGAAQGHFESSVSRFINEALKAVKGDG